MRVWSKTLCAIGAVAVTLCVVGLSAVRRDSDAAHTPMVLVGEDAHYAAVAEEYGSELRRALESEELFHALSSEQQEKYVRRVSSIMSVRDFGQCEDYISLMEEWGGRFPYDPKHTDDPVYHAEGEKLKSGWVGAEHQHGVRDRRIEEATFRLVDSGEPNGANRRPAMENNEASVTAISSFVFDQHARRMAASGAVSAEVTVPVTLRNGVRQKHTVVMLWSEDEREWLPYMLVKIQKKEGGERVPFYLDFF